MARLKIAMASVKEMQAEYGAAKSGGAITPSAAIAEARLDAAKARAELAQMEVESCTLRAPFNGRIMAVHVSAGQYLSRGTTILEIDDVSSLRVLLPVDKTAVTVGGNVTFTVEGSGVTGKVQAVLPLAESHATLRELASPLAAAWVTVANRRTRSSPASAPRARICRMPRSRGWPLIRCSRTTTATRSSR